MTTLATLLLDVTAGPAGFNMVAAGFYAMLFLFLFVAVTEYLARD